MLNPWHDRLPQYVAAIRGGEINADPQWRTQAGAVVILDADRAPGVSALLRGLDPAIAIAERLHIGWCSVRNMGHGGAIGFIAELGAKRGMALIVDRCIDTNYGISRSDRACARFESFGNRVSNSL